MEMPAIHLLLKGVTRALLGRGQMIGLPAQAALFPQDRNSAEGVAAMQGQGVIENVENTHQAALIAGTLPVTA
jgi:hypothetical protein